MTAAQRRAPRLILIGFALACGLWLLRLDYGRRISTNVLDLVPRDERSEELSAVRDLADQEQTRVALFAVEDPRPGAPAPLAAARRLAAVLQGSSAFAEVDVMADDKGQERLGRALYADRTALLLPTWLGEQERAFGRTGLPPRQYPSWVADRAAARLETYLARPEAMPLQQLLPADPLLLLPTLIDKARSLGPPAGGPAGTALVWTRIAASPLSEAGQRPVAAAAEAGIAAVAGVDPALAVRWTGIGRFAEASRTRIEREIKLLNMESLAAVLLVSCLFVRRMWKLVHLVPVILCSLLGAWTVSTLVFPRLHILVFAIGSLLSGVAIDYGFYIYLQPYRSEAEDYPGKLHRLLRPLLASCLTTVAGFALLLFSDLPLIRQVGLFVSAGLLAALGAAMLYFAQLRRPLLEGRALPQPRRWTGARALGRGAALVAAAVALLAPWRLHWRDDVRELDLPQPTLQANDAAVRRLFGDNDGRAVYLTYGRDQTEARQHLAEFLDYLGEHSPQADPVSLGLVLPTRADYAALPARLRALQGFPAAFRAALARRGFLPQAFSAFFIEWDAALRAPPRATYDSLVRRVDGLLSGPMRLLASTSATRAWYITLAEGPAMARPPAGLHTVNASELQNLNRLFTEYRWSALRLSLVGLALVIASVFAIYPLRRAVRIAVIPAGSCFFVFGLLGLLGQTLNLFHLLGAFLGVCLAHNYSIFSSDSAAARAAPPLPVRLSGLCAAASFGVLATSHIPVVHALGLTVSLIVLTALAAIEIERLARSPA